MPAQPRPLAPAYVIRRLPAPRCEPAYDDGGYTTWLIGGGSVSVGAHSEVHGPNAHPGRIIWNIETPDVKAEFDRFKAAGATVIREPYSFEGYPDSWIATLADPDDNYFQLMTPMEPPTTRFASPGFTAM